VKGYTIISERELENGKLEVVLELPITGRDALTKHLAE
jgi:hypothetical protein